MNIVKKNINDNNKLECLMGVGRIGMVVLILIGNN